MFDQILCSSGMSKGIRPQGPREPRELLVRPARRRRFVSSLNAAVVGTRTICCLAGADAGQFGSPLFAGAASHTHAAAIE